MAEAERTVDTLKLWLGRAMERVILNDYKPPRSHHGGLAAAKRHMLRQDLQRIGKYNKLLEQLEEAGNV